MARAWQRRSPPCGPPAGAARVFREVTSGARTDRAQLRKAIAALEPGSVLLVTRLDRLARSTRDLLNTLAAITDRGAGSAPWATPRPTPGRRRGG